MKITSPDTLAQALKNARKEKALTQQDISARIGVKQTTVSSFENHPERTRVETLFKLLAALNLELSVVERGRSERGETWDEEW
ncbi:MAG: transcriptional regulator [Marinobacter sp. 34-60-7]|nr:MAG: transcriptional regulator [Marinobacter sp. 34-60-7]